ncbi:MAG: hypothetical protein ACE5OZ_23120 [Candidatus Heimdallarchaeota archaeon]
MQPSCYHLAVTGVLLEGPRGWVLILSQGSKLYSILAGAGGRRGALPERARRSSGGRELGPTRTFRTLAPFSKISRIVPLSRGLIFAP